MANMTSALLLRAAMQLADASDAAPALDFQTLRASLERSPASLAQALMDPLVALAISLWLLTAVVAGPAARRFLLGEGPVKLLDDASRPWASELGDGFWHIDGRRYDLAPFVALHPGGARSILLGKGRECTALFRSYHAFTDRPSAMLKRFLVDEAGVKPLYTWAPDGFTAEVTKAVCQSLREQGLHASATLSAQGLMWSCLLGFFVCYWYWLLGRWWTLPLLPWLYWLSGSVMLHNGAHFSISHRPWLNELCTLLGSAHTSPMVWGLQHVVAHHQYTNLATLDPDLHHFVHEEGILQEVLGWRCHPEQPWLEKYSQWRDPARIHPLLTTFGISLLHDLEFLLRQTLWGAVALPRMTARRRLLHLFGRALVAVLGFILPFSCVARTFDAEGWPGFLRPTGVLKAMVFMWVPWLLHGGIYFTFSQISHVNAECFDGAAQHAGRSEGSCGDWGTHQVLSTWDYSVRDPLVGFISNGLNNQIVHHLFPGVHPCHFPSLAPVVAEVARRHGLDLERRQADTFSVALRRLWRWIGHLNDAPLPLDLRQGDLKAREKKAD